MELVRLRAWHFPRALGDVTLLSGSSHQTLENSSLVLLCLLSKGVWTDLWLQLRNGPGAMLHGAKCRPEVTAVTRVTPLGGSHSNRSAWMGPKLHLLSAGGLWGSTQVMVTPGLSLAIMYPGGNTSAWHAPG